MNIRQTILTQLQQIAEASKKALPPLTDSLVLVDSGLDSLSLAILVTRLEDSLGLDPFTASEITAPPVTLGEFIQLYEHAAQSA